MPWVYEPGRDRKHKRNWRHNYPGFVEVANSIVAKCPHGMTLHECEHLLNTDSIEYRPGDGLTTILKEFTTSEIKWCIAPRQLILASRITVFRSFKIA